jgi:NADH:ubiquinone oxidoreductase subunit E
MAWITKNSGGMSIPRRSEPYLTAEMKERLTRETLPRYETKQGALIPTLHEVQHTHGWLPWQALEEIAAFLGLKPADVWDTASFYEEFWLQPKGAHVIAVCRSIACEVCDHKAITSAVKAKLNIEVGETTDDDRFTLVELECLGLCEGAPACLVDEKMHLGATPTSIVQAIDALNAADAAHANGHGHGHDHHHDHHDLVAGLEPWAKQGPGAAARDPGQYPHGRQSGH